MDKNLHRNQLEKVYKLTESLKNVIHILGNVIQGLGHSWAPIEETTACLTGVIPEWIYCHIVDQTSDLLMHRLLFRPQNIELGAREGF